MEITKMKTLSFLCLISLTFSAYAEDSVKILSLTPLNNSPFYAGQEINIEVEVQYNLESSENGAITLVIQRAESGHRVLANESDFVLKGNGIVKLNKKLIIPETRGLIIFTPLSPEGSNSTTIVDSKMYKVLTN